MPQPSLEFWEGPEAAPRPQISVPEFLLMPDGRKVERGLFAVDTKLGGWFRAAGRARVKPVTAEGLRFE